MRNHVAWYMDQGFNPLPSDGQGKKPVVRFKDLWECPIPWADWDGAIERHADLNVQVMTGRYWDLLVIDVDGLDIAKQWIGKLPRTWTVQSGSGNSYHLWYRLPPGWKSELPKLFVWQDADKTAHRAVERLCDRSLIVAPPSLHHRTGEPYRWVKGRSPADGPRAIVPSWILSIRPPERKSTWVPPEPLKLGRGAPVRSIAGLAGLLRLRLVGGPDGNGWIACRAIDREDRHPSCSWNQESGWFHDHKVNQGMSVYELMVTRGLASDELEAWKMLRS